MSPLLVRTMKPFCDSLRSDFCDGSGRLAGTPSGLWCFKCFCVFATRIGRTRLWVLPNTGMATPQGQ